MSSGPEKTIVLKAGGYCRSRSLFVSLIAENSIVDIKPKRLSDDLAFD
jgi:hypothetical protein